MRIKRLSVGVLALIVVGFFVVAGAYLHHVNIPVLEPRGPVAKHEQQLIIIALLMSLTVVVPLFILLFVFSWKYRASNTKAKYSPDFDHSRILESIWWLIPTILIGILSVITWRSTHELDPFKPLASSQPQMTIQVVAEDWKWLFIYPQQRIASVNYVQVPTGTPVDFEVTSDSVMNSFWVPQLGGQIYAMPGMSTQLHLMATSNGSYTGSSANISGAGFAGMTFVTKATSQAAFDHWVTSVQASPDVLTAAAYSNLAKPSTNNRVAYYSSPAQNLYDTIVLKYNLPADELAGTGGSGTNMTAMSGMNMDYMP